MHSIPLRHTAPLWLLDHFLTSGHDAATTCATATFVRRKGRPYLVTCKHVLDAVVHRRRSGEGQKTLSLRVGHISMNLSSVGPGGVDLPLLTPLHDHPAGILPDIALAPLSESHWDILVTRGDKLAVDLDQWRAPDWSSVSCCLATGYLNEHKETATHEATQYVETPFVRVTAELASSVTEESPSFALSSRLEEPQEFRLSGTSGGLVYAIEGARIGDTADDDDLVPAGIVYEGWPSTDAENDRDSTDAFFNERDLFIRAATLSPDAFDDMLARCGVA